MSTAEVGVGEPLVRAVGDGVVGKETKDGVSTTETVLLRHNVASVIVGTTRGGEKSRQVAVGGVAGAVAATAAEFGETGALSRVGRSSSEWRSTSDAAEDGAND